MITMRNIRILKKYKLPVEVKVKINKTREGFYVEFPEYPGLMTQAEDWQELVYMVTDALLTHFEVPHKVAKDFSIYYLPPISSKAMQPTSINKAVLFHALTSAKNSYEYSGVWN